MTNVQLAIEEMKFGKLEAGHDSRVMLIGDVLRQKQFAKLRPAANLKRVVWSRKLNVPALGTMLNTRLGDCTCASKGHDIQLWTAWTGTQAVIPDAEILKVYETVSGYSPNKPGSDRGARIVDVLKYWRNNPIAGHHLDGFTQASAGSIQSIKDCIWVFGNCDVGLLLPRTCLQQGVWRLVSKSGDGAPGSAGGHDVNIVDFDDAQQLLTCITWGHLKQMSYNFYNFYNDEAWGPCSKEWLLSSNHLTPSDVSYDDLVAYLNQGF